MAAALSFRVFNALLRRVDGTDDSTSTDTNIDTGNSNLDEFLNLMSSPFKSEFESDSVEAALYTSLPLFAFATFCFCVIRPRHREIYAPKLKLADEKHKPPPVGKGIFAWIPPIVARNREDEMADKIGLDATIFLRFVRMLRNLFLLLSCIGCGVMLPVNILFQNKKISTGAFLSITTPQYVQTQSAYWAHVVLAWVFDITICVFLWYSYGKVRRLRRLYFAGSEYQMSLHARTLLITDIPPNLRSDEGILRITDPVNPTGVLPRANIGRNAKLLPKLLEEYEDHVKQLESVLAKYLKNPDKLPSNRPTMDPPKRKGVEKSGKVDAIDYLTERIKDLEHEIYDARERIDKRDAEPYGFASWEEIEEAHAVAYAARKKHPQGTDIVLAPRPNDLLFNNLAIGKHARRMRRVWNNFYVAILTLIWLPINAGSAVFLSNLSNLGLVWPAFQRSLEGHRMGWAVVQGIASPALSSAVYLLLPIAFRRLSMRAGDFTKTSRERHVVHNLYAFFVFNNLVMFSIFSALWSYTSSVISAKQSDESLWKAIRDEELFTKIMLALCQVSPYWITWLLQRNLGAAIDLVQLWNLFLLWFHKTFRHPTPRQLIEWTAPPPFDYANYYNYFLFYSTVALCFATLQPLVLPVTALYFVLDAWMKKYLLLYVFVTKTESGGQFWRLLYNRMIFAAILANLVIALVLIARGTWVMLGVLAPAPFCMIAFKLYCKNSFDPDLNFYVRSGMNDQEALAVGLKGKKIHHVNTKYNHPAMYKPLITPMVNAKAKHLLGEIYHGRLETDTAQGPYGDYVLGEMAPSKPGAAKRPDAPFELVSESEMDFANYKNRADFREEHSGGIYGRPEDLITERSQTPRSFVRQGTWSSQASSRASSPQDMGRMPSLPDIRTHPAFRDRNASVGDIGEVDMKGGLYTDPNGDDVRAGLLGHAQSTPMSGEHYGIDRWRTNDTQQTGYGRVQQDMDDDYENHDYFRGKR